MFGGNGLVGTKRTPRTGNIPKDCLRRDDGKASQTLLIVFRPLWKC
jgi:hypothetical protein